LAAAAAAAADQQVLPRSNGGGGDKNDDDPAVAAEQGVAAVPVATDLSPSLANFKVLQLQLEVRAMMLSPPRVRIGATPPPACDNGVGIST
jgi:hypothetical protein